MVVAKWRVANVRTSYRPYPVDSMRFLLLTSIIKLLENLVLCSSSPANLKTSKFAAASDTGVLSILLWASTSVEFDCAVLSAWSCSILYPSLYMMLSFLLSSVPLDDVANRLWGKISCRKNRAHQRGFTHRYFILKCYANFCMVKIQKWKQSKLTSLKKFYIRDSIVFMTTSK